MSNDNFAGTWFGILLMTIVVAVVLFLIFREIICWYWKINQNIALLTEIRDLLARANLSSTEAHSSRTQESIRPARTARAQTLAASDDWSAAKPADPSGAKYRHALERMGFVVSQEAFGFSITNKVSGASINAHSVDALRMIAKSEAKNRGVPFEES